MGIGDEGAVGPVCDFGFFEERDERDAIDGERAIGLESADFGEGGKDVDVRGELGNVAALGPAFLRPVEEEGDTVAAFGVFTFAATHAGVVDFHATDGAVVGGVNEEGVFGRADVGEFFAELADVVVDIGNHAEEGGEVAFQFRIEVEVFLRGVEGAVGSIGGDVGEEGLFGFVLGFDEFECFVEEDIGAEAFGLHGLAVFEVGVIEVGVVPEVGRLADAAAAVDVGFLEAAVLRLVGEAVAEVPLAEDAGGVAGLAEVVGDGGFVGAEKGAAHDGVPGAGAIGEAAGHEGGPCWGAGGGDVVVGEAKGLGVELVEVGSLDDGVSVAGEIAVALVIGDDEDDVGEGVALSREETQKCGGDEQDDLHEAECAYEEECGTLFFEAFGG